MRIIVSPLTAAALSAAEEKPEKIISFCDVKSKSQYFQGYDSKNILLFRMNDVREITANSRPPNAEDIERLLNFLTGCDIRKTLLIHCVMGISRSMAAALIALCLPYPGQENEICEYMRKKAPHAAPNPLMIRHADRLLGRKGKLTEAITNLPDVNLKTAGQAVTLRRDFL